MYAGSDIIRMLHITKRPKSANKDDTTLWLIKQESSHNRMAREINGLDATPASNCKIL